MQPPGGLGPWGAGALGPWGPGALGGWGPELLSRCIAWQGLGPGTEFGVQLLLWPVVLVRYIALPPIRPRSPRVV